MNETVKFRVTVGITGTSATAGDKAYTRFINADRLMRPA